MLYPNATFEIDLGTNGIYTELVFQTPSALTPAKYGLHIQCTCIWRRFLLLNN